MTKADRSPIEASWKGPKAKPEVSPELIEELVSLLYDAFHPLQIGSEQEDHVRSLQTALKRLVHAGANL